MTRQDVTSEGCQCPWCGSMECSAQERVSVETLIREWSRWEQLDVRDELPDCGSLTLYECAVCGLLWFYPISPGSDRLYAQLDKQDWYYQPVRGEYAWAMRDLCAHSRVLEVGCGTGSFLSLAAEAGHSVSGLELNPNAIEICRGKGLEVAACDIGEFASRHQGQFDAVCAFQVLEHVRDPAGLVRCMRELLHENGRVIVSVPNVDSFKKHTFNCLDTPPHHVTRWRKRSFLRGAPSLGLLPVRVKPLPLESRHISYYSRAIVSHWSRRWPVVRGREYRIVPALDDLIRRLRLHRLLAGEGLYVFCMAACSP